jgi:copper(I)-binding protein
VHHTLSATRRVALAAALTALTLGVAGCGATSSTTAADPTTSAPALTLDDGWVKAVDVPASGASPSMTTSESDGDEGMEGAEHGTDSSMPMTAVFGTLRNATDSEITVSGGSSPAAGTVELHEVVRTDSGSMQMQPKPGGFVIAAGADHTLQPGGDHIMLLGLTESLVNGTETSLTLQTSAGDVTFTVPVRTFSGAEESYAPDPSDS